MNKTIYLCGPIADRTDAECQTWRSMARALWSGECLDPMRRDYRGVSMSKEISKKIVDDNLLDIDNSDGLLVYYDKPFVGTSMEIFYAHTKNKPVVLINATSSRLSPWLINHVSEVTSNIPDALFELTLLMDADEDDGYYSEEAADIAESKARNKKENKNV